MVAVGAVLTGGGTFELNGLEYDLSTNPRLIGELAISVVWDGTPSTFISEAWVEIEPCATPKGSCIEATGDVDSPSMLVIQADY